MVYVLLAFLKSLLTRRVDEKSFPIWEWSLLVVLLLRGFLDFELLFLKIKYIRNNCRTFRKKILFHKESC